MRAMHIADKLSLPHTHADFSAAHDCKFIFYVLCVCGNGRDGSETHEAYPDLVAIYF